MFRKFDLKDVFDTVDRLGIENYDKQYGKAKYLITNTSLHLDHFIKVQSIDHLQQDEIKDSLFFLHFDSDDEFLPHLDKIISNGGKFIIQKNYGKHNYVYASRKCNLALTSTLKCINEISHYNELIHGNICQALDQTRNLEGDYVEIGVFKGGSALTALNYMKHAGINRRAYLLDTFNGFDYEEATNSSETHWQVNNNSHILFGTVETKQYIQRILSRECPEARYELVESNICRDPLPAEIDKIAVANIDVDLYDATRDAVQKVAEKLVLGGIIIAEDPTSTPGLIGAFYAMEKFLETPLGKKFMKLHLVGQYFLIKIHE